MFSSGKNKIPSFSFERNSISTLCPKSLSSAHFPVFGMICIRPTAPFLETTSSLNPLSAFIMLATSAGSTPNAAEYSTISSSNLSG